MVSSHILTLFNRRYLIDIYTWRFWKK